MRPSTYDRVKRISDIALASAGLVLSSPIQLAVAALVRAKLGSPVLFRQERPGMDGRLFTLVKFRTMVPSDPERGLVTDDDRMTKLGRLLRATSMDELPTLWNVLRGDMSIVGPRPLLPEYLELYDERQARRHEVRPGLTGLAQVNGRNALDWPRKLELDVQYVDNRSVLLDVVILVRTIRLVLRRSGISGQGTATVRPFRGSAEYGSVE